MSEERDMPSIFICYSHQDKGWRDRLLKFLQPLNDEEKIVWSDLDIQPGDIWDEKIKDSLSQVTIAMVLVSQDLLNSRYVKNEELPRLLQRREQEGVVIIPIFVRHCTVKSVSFKYTNEEGIEQRFYLHQFQSPNNNSPSNPLCDLTKSACEKVFVSLEETLRSLIEESKKKQSDESQKTIVKTEKTAAPRVAVTALMNTTLPPVNEWQGRQQELQELLTALDNDQIHLIGIVATGGYGKTALAVKFREQLIPHWRVLWVSFRERYSVAQFGRWLLENLEQPYDEKWNDETLIQQMIRGLITAPCLLILDNLETVVQTAGDSVYRQFLSRWLGSGNQSKILITSREQPSFVPNLTQRCHWLRLGGLAAADAIQLVTVDYGLTGTNQELAEFVNKMGRHPLLMQLVCSWMSDEFGEGVSVTESQNLGLNLFEVEGYHRDTETCVREVITASLGRLAAQLRESLTRLSVLRESFDLGLAQGLTPEITDQDLRHFACLSLLQEFPPEYNVKRRQFQFLPLISMVVQDQANPEILRSAHQLALDYYLAHLPSPPWESFADVTAYLEAFYHAGALGEWQLAYDILNEERGGEGKDKSVEEFLDLQGFYRKRAELYEEIIAGSQREQVCYRNSLNRLGLCYDSLGQYEKAIAYHQQCHDISKEIGYQQGVAISLCGLGNCYDNLGQYEKAIALYQQYHDISEEIGNRQGVASSLGNLGICYKNLGQYEKAISLYQQYRNISEEIGFQQGVAHSLGNLGNCYDLLGQHENAIAHHQQSLKIEEEMGDRQGVAISLGSLGNSYYSLGKYEKAIAYNQQSLEISKEVDDRQETAISLGSLGNCYDSLGQYEKAITYHQQHHDISEEIGFRQGVASSLNNIGEALLK
ncbi:MAG: tetratricopeptide repeat protein, partial [Microcystis panniformis]